ncbi:Ppx/GppA phosphatase family protein [Lacrimispora celerecrescens]|uniref:Exopolyphosphatase/guanosine-5'-triphosphate, 3'-diphosphate pyrophosphatase n=1 Tax=[Clostridium] celerecrescens 18A TaxID=1286362 RepID=A0A2M8Z8P8_9FIRM|nr:exopolyphosphatase [Lacrimispora celerecrescens]PJJ29819.1 exopolyphosphatase/guanosine-5'-triphosphate,3'-diphosphate pyrophosphatase [[Clostridium] celerecrescens 18A]
MAIRLFAAIDVGSFELELGIYEISAKTGIRKVDHVRHVIALGRDTYNDGKISYELVEEMCQVIKDFADIMQSYKVIGYRAYATSALREAKNSRIVLDQIRVRTGIEVRVISNSEQRFISYKAIASKDAEFHKIIQKGTAIVDVGFGSMQVSLFDRDALVSTHNLMLGVLRIREMMGTVQVDNQMQNTLIEEMVDNELYTFRKVYLKDREIKNLIGIGESILYLSRGSRGGKPVERVTAEEFAFFYEKIVEMSLDQIQERFGVNSEYATLLVPAAIIFKRVLELTKAELFWIPGIRLCDSIAAEFAEETKAVKFNHDFSEDILAASRNMAKRYKCHGPHTVNMEKYVVDIFDSMKKYHGMGKRERLLLQIAAILHACGKFISMRNPSESAYHIIMSTEIIGLSHMEREIVANAVRYNGVEFDYNRIHLSEEVFRNTKGEFPHKDSIILVGKLTAILRLANSLDRSHKQKLSDIHMSVKNGQLVVTASYEGDITLESMAFRQKADFFEEIFGIRPILKQKRRLS